MKPLDINTTDFLKAILPFGIVITHYIPILSLPFRRDYVSVLGIAFCFGGDNSHSVYSFFVRKKSSI